MTDSSTNDRLVPFPAYMQLEDWEATPRELKLTIYIPVLRLRRGYVRYHYYSSYSGGRWFWCLGGAGKDGSDRTPLDQHQDPLTVTLDALIMRDETLRRLAVTYGYGATEELKDSLDKISEATK